jgi:hypothetical protein
MAAWRGFEPEDGGLAERARTRTRNSGLYSPPAQRDEIEHLAHERKARRADDAVASRDARDELAGDRAA